MSGTNRNKRVYCYLEVDCKKLDPLTKKRTLSEAGTAIGLTIAILQLSWSLGGKGVSRRTLPAAQISK